MAAREHVGRRGGIAQRAEESATRKRDAILGRTKEKREERARSSGRIVISSGPVEKREERVRSVIWQKRFGTCALLISRDSSERESDVYITPLSRAYVHVELLLSPLSSSPLKRLPGQG